MVFTYAKIPPSLSLSLYAYTVPSNHIRLGQRSLAKLLKIHLCCGNEQITQGENNNQIRGWKT